MHVDDICVASDESEGDWIEKELGSRYELSVSGPVPEGECGNGETLMYLKKTLLFTPEGVVTICHEKYVEQLSKLYNMENRKNKSVPEHSKLGDVDLSVELGPEEIALFRSALGVALYLSQERYDIQFCTKMLSSYMKCPTVHAEMCMKQLVLYLQGNPNMGVLMRYSQKGACAASRLNDAEYLRPDHVVECFCDSDWSGNKQSRCSTTSVISFLDGIPVHSHCRGQKSIALSSCEAEILALTSGAAESIHLCNMWRFLTNEPTTLEMRSDSSSARQWLQRSGVGRLKHFAARLCWVQQAVKDGTLNILPIGTKKNVSDLNTKKLSSARRRLLLHWIGFVQVFPDGSFEEIGKEEYEQQVLEDALASQVRRVSCAFKKIHNPQAKALMNVLLMSQMVQTTTADPVDHEDEDGDLFFLASILVTFMCVVVGVAIFLYRFLKSKSVQFKNTGVQTEELAYAYVSRSGGKYHDQNCPRIRRSEVQKALALQFRQEQYGNCAVCNPERSLR